MLAWCGTTRSTSSRPRPAFSSARAASGQLPDGQLEGLAALHAHVDARAPRQSPRWPGESRRRPESRSSRCAAVSVVISMPRVPPGSSEAESTVAPAPSPKRMQVARSVKSVQRLIVSEPMTSDMLCQATDEIRMGHGVAVHEAGAGCGQIHRGGPGVADGLLDQHGRRRKRVIRSERADEDQVDVFRLQSRPWRWPAGRRWRPCWPSSRRGRRCAARECPCEWRSTRRTVSTICSRSALVRTQARGVGAPARHMDSGQRARHHGSTSISGCFALTSLPDSATMRTTLPAWSDLISLNSFMASIRPMTCPTVMCCPTAT